MSRRLALLLLASLLAAGCRSRSSVPPSLPIPPQIPPGQLAENQSPSPTVGGVSFADRMDLGCTSLALSDSTPAEIAASPLRLHATYVPEGYALLKEEWASCDGRVAMATAIYQDVSGRRFTVARYTARTYPRPLEEMRILKAPVAGKPTIAVGARALILVETFGITVIEGAAGLGDLTRVAEGLRQP